MSIWHRPKSNLLLFWLRPCLFTFDLCVSACEARTDHCVFIAFVLPSMDQTCLESDSTLYTHSQSPRHHLVWENHYQPPEPDQIAFRQGCVLKNLFYILTCLKCWNNNEQSFWNLKKFEARRPVSPSIRPFLAKNLSLLCTFWIHSTHTHTQNVDVPSN